MGTFEEQISRLAAAEVEPGDPLPSETPAETTPPGPNAQQEGQAYVEEPPTAEPPQQAAEGEEAAPTGEEEPPAKGVQKRIDQLTRQKYEARRELEYWRKVALEGGQQPAPISQQPQTIPLPPFTKPVPKIEDFANEQDPYAALAFAAGRYEAEKINFENQQRAYYAQQQHEVQQQQTARQRLIQEKMEAGRAKYADFEAATDDLGPVLAQVPVLGEALLDSERFPELAYYLADHMDEVKRLSKLTPLGMAREIGKLEDKLAVTSANPQLKEVRTPTRVEPAGSGLPKAVPNTQKMFEAAKQGGTLRDWQKYLEATETYNP
jgi:hypothetical protein